MQFTNILLPLLFAITGANAQQSGDATSVTTYYTTFTVSRVVETTTCTSTTTPAAESTTEAPIVSTSEAPVSSSSPSTSFTTELLTQTVQRIAASSAVSSSMATVYPIAASASAVMPHASTNGTGVASPTLTPYTGAASGLTIQFGAAAVIAAVAGVAQML
ncbi:unnamed protein product [Aureobasidium vineae]|uniref:Uncharacterized protein n=1 Tax=Aureobasidium vineae TaxID=2773715 RepID=A0A9N8P6E6_9PEZI|nr:unnamed protein product [Aureobasidium vineae]